MAKLTYNVLTQEVTWDCPTCRHINSFCVEERLTTIVCEVCRLNFPLDPIRYVQFKKIQEIFDDNLIELLGWQKNDIPTRNK